MEQDKQIFSEKAYASCYLKDPIHPSLLDFSQMLLEMFFNFIKYKLRYLKLGNDLNTPFSKMIMLLKHKDNNSNLMSDINVTTKSCKL